MINDNYKQLEKLYLESFASGSGMVSVANVSGFITYAAPTFAFPASRTQTFTLSATTAGISFGTGTTAATELDYNLEETITAGISVTVDGYSNGYDSSSGQYVEYVFSITNSGESSITIGEVGYKQNISSAPYVGSTSRSNQVCLIDRTVLETPLTIGAGETKTLTYRLITLFPEKTVNNVKIVPWEFGSDEDITAMIQAAHAGTIDLQSDAGWRVGAKRPIDIAAFTGGNNVSHDAQTIDLVITSFDDYENCGCVMQVDFDEELATAQRMNSSNTNVGGYSATEMYTTTIPALLQALPQYLQDMLITFDVKVSSGNKSTEIETISGNKLALRSVMELLGTNTSSVAGEGEWVSYFEIYTKAKRRGRAGSANSYFTRSPVSGNAANFCTMNSSGAAASTSASTAAGVSPFACL